MQTVKMGSERNLTIRIGRDIYGQLEAIGQKHGATLEDELIEAIKSHVERAMVYSSDSFFQIGKAGKSGLKDLAKSHDKYLYGRTESE